MLTKSDIQKITNCLYECNSIARDLRSKGLEISYKKDKSPVTNADTAISKHIASILTELYPEIDIICEENEVRNSDGEYFWLIDPIDGTRGYIKNHNIYSVNIGLVKGDIAQYGFISVPDSERIYYCDENQKLQLEESRKIIDIQEPSGEFKAVLSGDYSQKAKAHEIMRMHEITNYEYVPCSVKFCLIAIGAADIYPRYGRTMEWDTAAGSALIKASGGIINDLEGYELGYSKDDLVNEGFIAYSKRLVERGID